MLIRWPTAGNTSPTTPSHPPSLPSSRIESQKSPIAVPTPPVNIPTPQITIAGLSQAHQPQAHPLPPQPQPQRPTPIPRRRFVPSKWYPLPARIHTRHDDITQYHAPGTHGWEDSHCRRVLEAELRVGEIDHSWAAGGGRVCRDFRAELVEWARLVREEEEELGEQSEQGGGDSVDGNSVDGDSASGDSVDGREEKGRKREHKEGVDENGITEEETGDESGWDLWTSTERMLARMGRRRRAI
jgi:hypothetical protein